MYYGEAGMLSALSLLFFLFLWVKKKWNKLLIMFTDSAPNFWYSLLQVDWDLNASFAT